jgi:hypothetical protein
MRKVALRSLIALVLPSVLVLARVAPGHADSFPLCITVPTVLSGAPTIDLRLQALSYGPYFQLAGEAIVTQAVAPPNGIIVYSLGGSALQNADGFWLSLGGAGYNEANEVFNGLFAIQLSDDAAKKKLTYQKIGPEGPPPTVFTGIPEITTCVLPRTTGS